MEEFRTRLLDEAGPFTFVAADALPLKVREAGRAVPMHALVATAVNRHRHHAPALDRFPEGPDPGSPLRLTARHLVRLRAANAKSPVRQVGR